MATVSVIGLGYMGLPTAALAARAKHHVVGVDIQQKVVDAVNAGTPHFKEPGLANLLKKALRKKRLRATCTTEPADVFIIAVPTPVNPKTHKADMSYVRAAAQSIAPVLAPGNLVILESTSPLGATVEHVQNIISKHTPALRGHIHYAFCPERAIPGHTLHEMVHNDRYVGGLGEEATQAALQFYRTFVKGTLIPTDARTAEMVKLVENASRDVQIAFSNELHLVCDELGLNVHEVIRLANRHPRVNLLQPGVGVGGHCIPVDPWFIIQASPKTTPLMATARQVNSAKPQWVVNKIKQALKQRPRASVALLGLAYKPDVEDLRDAPALEIYKLLKAQSKAPLLVCEPHLPTHPDIPLVPLKEALQAEIIVLTTGHKIFRALTPTQLAGKVVIDPAGSLPG
jgi:UDP-N-acetyl-D-mannosaminuronic acid dehydrogenase